MSWNPCKKRWVVLIRHGGVTHWVGTYHKQIEAEVAAIAKCEEFATPPRRRGERTAEEYHDLKEGR